MYFESRQHTSHLVANADEAARLILSRNRPINHAFIWRNSRGQQIAAVDDSHIDDAWGEVAVINLDLGIQLESITFPGLTPGQAASYLTDCQDDTKGYGNARLPLDGSNDTTPASFECSCCATDFTSTLADQSPHDQDMGYGLCPECV